MLPDEPGVALGEIIRCIAYSASTTSPPAARPLRSSSNAPHTLCTSKSVISRFHSAPGSRSLAKRAHAHISRHTSTEAVWSAAYVAAETITGARAGAPASRASSRRVRVKRALRAAARELERDSRASRSDAEMEGCEEMSNSPRARQRGMGRGRGEMLARSCGLGRTRSSSSSRLKWDRSCSSRSGAAGKTACLVCL